MLGKPLITKQVLTVEKVWLSDGEEAEFNQILRFLEDTRRRSIVNQYERLQSAAVDFVKSSVRYKFGRIYSDLDSIRKIWAAEQNGEKFDRGNPCIAPGYRLMHEHPRLSGLVEEFKRDLRQIIFSRAL